MMQIPENDLFARIKGGDVQAFESLFKSLYQPLCNYACAFLKDIHESEEAVQQVFLHIWERRSRTEITDSVQSYLYRAVKNECLNKLKHIKVKRGYRAEMEYAGAQSADSLNENVLSAELETEITAAVESLPGQCRKIFLMSRTDGKKYREIAGELGISVKTVENQMGKALRVLREKLADFLPVVFFFVNILMNRYFGK